MNTKALLGVVDGELERAVGLFSAAAALEPQIGHVAHLGMKERVDAALDLIKVRLGSDLFNRTWEGGKLKSAKKIVTEG